jgi:hypothetical protein
MVLEFQRRIGEFRPLLGLHGTAGDTDCPQVVMDYFGMVYHHDLCYHSRFSVLSSYATWFNEGHSTFILLLVFKLSFKIFCLTVMVLSYVTNGISTYS